MDVDIYAPFESSKYNEFEGFIKLDDYTEVYESGIFTGEFVDGIINEFVKDGKTGAILNIRLADRASQTYVSTTIPWVNYKTARYSLMAHTFMLLAYDPFIRELAVIPQINQITTKNNKTMTFLDLPPGRVFKVVLDFDGTTKNLNNGSVIHNNNCLGVFSESGFTPLEMRDGKQQPEKLKKALERLENNQRERATKGAAFNNNASYQQPQAPWQNQPPPPPPPQNYGNYQQPQNNYQQPRPSYVQTPEQRKAQQQQSGNFNANSQKWQPQAQQPGNVMPPPLTSGSPMPPPPPPGGFKSDDLPF